MSAVRGTADAAAVVIAGGKASRMGGRVKALMEIDGRTVLSRMLEVLSPRFAAIAISANDPTPYHHTGLPVLPDQVLGQGPLAGLAAALRWCRRPYLLAVAGDMPYPDPRLIDLLLSRRAPRVDIIAPFVGDRPEPLFALYSRRVLPAVEQRLASGRLDARGLVTDEGLRLTRVYEPELRAIDPTLRCLTNLNVAADLAGAVA
jgi:molybdopterin-guanine dinucleotide biosynthesis protein A